MNLETLHRITSSQPPPAAGERCEMCAAPVADEHQHVVDVQSRSLMCVCRPCYLLFTDQQAELRYRAVPDRYLSFPDFGSTGPTGTTCRSPWGWRSSSPTARRSGWWRSTRARPGPPSRSCR